METGEMQHEVESTPDLTANAGGHAAQARLLDVVRVLVSNADIATLMDIPETQWKAEDSVEAFVFAQGVLQRGMLTMAACGAMSDLIIDDPWLMWMGSLGDKGLQVVVSEAKRRLRRRSARAVERARVALAEAEAKLAALGTAGVAP